MPPEKLRCPRESLPRIDPHHSDPFIGNGLGGRSLTRTASSVMTGSCSSCCGARRLSDLQKKPSTSCLVLSLSESLRQVLCASSFAVRITQDSREFFTKQPCDPQAKHSRRQNNKRETVPTRKVVDGVSITRNITDLEGEGGREGFGEKSVNPASYAALSARPATRTSVRHTVWGSVSEERVSKTKLDRVPQHVGNGQGVPGGPCPMRRPTNTGHGPAR